MDLRGLEVRDVVDGARVLTPLWDVPFDPHPQSRVSLNLQIKSCRDMGLEKFKRIPVIYTHLSIVAHSSKVLVHPDSRIQGKRRNMVFNQSDHFFESTSRSPDCTDSRFQWVFSLWKD